MAEPGWYGSEDGANAARYWNGTEWVGATVEGRPQTAGGYDMIPPVEFATAAAYGQPIGRDALAHIYGSSTGDTAAKPSRVMTALYWVLFLTIVAVVAMIAWQPLLGAWESTTGRGQGFWRRTRLPTLAYGLLAGLAVPVVYLAGRKIYGRT